MNLYGFISSNGINVVDLIGLLPGNPFASSAKEAQKFYDAFRERFGDLVNKYAKLNCIPRRLLALVIENELADYSEIENGYEHLGLGSSVGPPQITIATAMTHNATVAQSQQFSRSHAGSDTPSNSAHTR